jgi:hypothetical protein
VGNERHDAINDDPSILEPIELATDVAGRRASSAIVGSFFFDLSQSMPHARCYAITMKPQRIQMEAHRVAKLAYPYPGCCLCGQTVGIELAHLAHNSTKQRTGQSRMAAPASPLDVRYRA